MFCVLLYCLCHKDESIECLSYLTVYGMSFGELPGGHFKKGDKSVVVLLQWCW
jgi:hypothetical protein